MHITDLPESPEDNIPTINLELETRKIGQYNIYDIQRLFGNRIKDCICSDGKGGSSGLIGKEIIKKIKWWKFWNRDIRKAYLKYYGYIWMPWIIAEYHPTKISMSRYSDKPVNPNYYTQFKINGNKD